MISQLTLAFEKRLEHNPAFDVLNNMSIDKLSVKHYQLVLQKYFAPFFDCYQPLPLVQKKRDKIKEILASQSSDDVM